MATVRIPDEQRTLTDQDEVTRYLATLGIDYERWPNNERVPEELRAARNFLTEELEARAAKLRAS